MSVLASRVEWRSYAQHKQSLNLFSAAGERHHAKRSLNTGPEPDARHHRRAIGVECVEAAVAAAGPVDSRLRCECGSGSGRSAVEHARHRRRRRSERDRSECRFGCGSARQSFVAEVWCVRLFCCSCSLKSCYNKAVALAPCPPCFFVAYLPCHRRFHVTV